jgi:NOL1/NOP2/fmu family ribosome biogenesis protein/23S rRNA U2552 (ribose-2'-O)-methylase RlmE/FtsJ
MTPASVLPIEPGDFVLDLCAAPGGKATELGSRLRGEGFLLANDISNSRAKGLLKNLELHGLHNICVSSETPDKLLKVYPEKFNKILVDAPCSGEGMFRKDPSLIKSYEEHGPEYYSNIQKEILDCAVQLLAPGGMLLYSTCTFSELEDEDVVQYVLDQYDEMSLCRIENRFEHFCEGRKGLTDCLRLFPHKIKGEGHFLALLQKESSHRKEANHSPQGFKICKEKEVMDFLNLIKWDFCDYQILEKDSLVYAIHKDLAIAPAVRFLRTGLLLGELKNGRFTPSQSFAMGLRMEDYPNCLDMKGSDERVIRYLKGETIFLNENEDLKNGYCLICVDSLPLGFAKIQGKNCKNKYQTGWRWQ